jgi:ribosomal protein S18 acetylase RimI-like enzyme
MHLKMTVEIALWHTLISQALPVGFALREETDEDFGFIALLYADSRAEELALTPWSEEEKQQFTHWQCGLQRDHYRKHYPNARFWILERFGSAVGRLYVDVGHSEIRIMDIVWLPELRGHGIGTAILQAILGFAHERSLDVSLHVEPANRAQSLYRRLGFGLAEERGVYQFLVCPHPQLKMIS